MSFEDEEEGPTDYPVEASTTDYFDPNAYSDQWPGVIGLWMRDHEWWQGDDAWHTYEEIGPGDDSVQTQPPDPSEPIYQPGPGGLIPVSSVPGSVFAGNGFTVNGIPLGPCEEDGVIGELIGSDEPKGITILLQGVYQLDNLYFPVPPETLTVEFPQDSDYEPDVVGIGEITIPGTMKLESVGWDSFFPVHWEEYVVVPEESMTDPQTYAIALIWTKRFRMPCRLIIDGTPWNEDVMIKSFSYTIKAGEPGDIYYNIQFKRYRTSLISTVAVPGGPVDPRDYPSFQGPPISKSDPAPKPGVNDATAQDDGTNDTQEPVEPTAPQGPVEGPNPNPSGTIQPAPSGATPGGSAPGTRQVDKVFTTDDYIVGAKAIGVQSIQDIYEDLKKQGYGDLNSVETLVNLNKDLLIINPPWDPVRRLGEGGLENAPLRLGQKVTYWKRTKETVPYVVGGDPNDSGSPQPRPGGGPF